MDIGNTNIWCWLIATCVGIVCCILGYYWGKGSSKTIDQTAELKMLRDKNAELQAAIDKNHDNASKESIAPVLSESNEKGNPPVTFNAVMAKAALGMVVKQDDLKIIEGIGPKIASMFKVNDIKTWKELSEVSVARCQEILDSGGNRYKIHDPASWPMQAKMCHEGKWGDLAKWQEAHKRGKL